jgi:hypothetical protein
MNQPDDGIIGKIKLVTWRFVNCVVYDGSLNISYIWQHNRDVLCKEYNTIYHM